MKKKTFAALTSLVMMPIGVYGTLKYWAFLHSCSIKTADWNVLKASLAIGLICWFVMYEQLYRPDPEEWSRKNKFSHPPVDKSLLHKSPCGIVFGIDTRTGRYVCQDTNRRGIAHELIIGGSGSGKSSSLIIPTLLVNREKTIVAVDIKGELSQKTVDLRKAQDDGHVCILNPNDRSICGYDPLYELNAIEEPTTQQIVSVWQQIAVCLINKSAYEKDPYWSESARAM